MKINLKFGINVYQFDVNNGESVISLKYKIYEKLKLNINSQRLLYYGFPLLNDQLLNVKENETINLILQLS